MTGYNVLIPDVSRQMSPEVALPVMDALQTLGHTPVVMEMAEIARMYQEMRYQRRGCYEIFAFYIKDLLRKHRIDFGFSVGLGIILEDYTKREAHHLLEECGVPNIIYLHNRDSEVVAKLDALGAREWAHTFIACTSRLLTDLLSQRGYDNVVQMLPGTSPRIFFPADSPPENAPYPLKLEDPWLTDDYEVSFVGSYERKRDQLLCALADVGISLAIYGDDGWKQSEKLLKFWRRQANYLTDLNTIYNSSKVNLDLPHDNCLFDDYVSVRVFDCLAGQNFITTYRRTGLEDVIELDHDLITYDSAEELVSVVKYYLSDEMARYTTAIRGYGRIKGEAYWSNRLSQVLPRLEMHVLTSVSN